MANQYAVKQNETPRSLRQIYLQAQSIEDSEARAKYLDEIGGKLRQQVEKLLAANTGREPSPLDAMEVMLHQATQVQESSLVEIRRHPVIGKYKLLERIGEGGMGEVFMAQQLSPVRRRVALKLIKPGMDSRSVVARFEAERQALAMMDHPNIAKVFDGGTTERGLPYFVMELIQGVPITNYCDDHKLDTRSRLELFRDVCRAIQHAHIKGIIHRDIKPSNVLVTLNDDHPIVKVIDFGVAKALEQELTDKTLFTRFGNLVGTPLYISPEQLQMNHLGIDTRSDVYSLGVLLYELLTGMTPYEKDCVVSAGIDEMRRIVMERDPPTPSVRLRTAAHSHKTIVSSRRSTHPRVLGDTLRGDLDWIVTKAMEKDRSRRYETAAAFADDVDRYLRGEVIQAVPPSTLYQLSKIAKKHRFALGSFVTILFCLVAGIGGTSWQAFQAVRARKVAEGETERAESNLQRVEQLNDQLAARDEKISKMLYATKIRLAMESMTQGDLLTTQKILDEWKTIEGGDRSRFEMRLLERLTKHFQPRLAWTAHSGVVNELALLSARQQLVSTGDDGLLSFWSVADGEPINSLPLNDGALTGLAIDAREERLAVGSNRPGLYDLKRNRFDRWLFPRSELPRAIESLAFSADGIWLAIGHRYKQIRIQSLSDATFYEIDAGARQESMFFHDGNMLRLFGTKCQDKSQGTFVQSWGITESRPVELERFEESAMQPNHRFLACPQNQEWFVTGGHNDGRLYFVDLATNALLHTIEVRGDPTLTAVDVNADGDTVAAGFADGSIRWFRVTMENHELQVLQEHSFAAHDDSVTSLKFLSNGELATGAADGTIKVWPRFPQLFHVVGPRDVSCARLGVNTAIGDNVQAMMRSDGGTLWFCNIREAMRFDSWRSFDFPFNLLDFRFLNSKPLAVIVGAEGQIGILDLEARIVEYRSAFEKGSVSAWDMSADNLLVASSPARGKLQPCSLVIREFSSLKETFRQEVSSDVRTLKFSPDGRWLAVGEGNGNFSIFEIEAACLQTIGRLKSAVRCIHWIDGEHLASGHDDGQILFWAISEDAPSACLIGHQGSVMSITTSPNGKTLLSGSADGTIRLWRVDDGASLGILYDEQRVRGNRLRSDENRFVHLMFTHDSRYLIAGRFGFTHSQNVLVFPCD